MDLFGARRVPFLSRRNYLCEMQHILGWGVIAGLVEGHFAAVVVAKTFGGGETLITVAVTTPVAAHIASMLWGMLSVGRPKVSLFTIATAGVVLLVGSVALTPASTSWGGWVFVSQMAAAQFFMTGAVTLRAALWKSNYPQYVRGQVAARLQIVRAMTRVFAVAAAAMVFDADPMSYRWVYPVSALVGLVAIRYLRRIHVRGERGELRRLSAVPSSGAEDSGGLVARSSLRAMLSPRHILTTGWRVLRSDGRFRRYCVAQFLAGCANLSVRGVAVAVIANHLLVDMTSAYWMSAVLLDVLPMLVLVASMSRFAHYYDRVGVVRFRVVHGLFWSTSILLGCCGTLAVVYADALGPYSVLLGVGLFSLFALGRGLCYAGGSIAWNLGHLHFAKADEAEVYMGIHVSLTGLRGLLLPGLGMLLWAVVGWWVWVVALFFSLASLASFKALERYEGMLKACNVAGESTPGSPRGRILKR